MRWTAGTLPLAPSPAAPPLTVHSGDADIARARTPDELRRVLRGELMSNRAVWIDANGLHLDDDWSHIELLRNVARYRRAVGPHEAPKTAVVDWSSVQGVGVEALAALPAVVQDITTRGGRVISCEPADAHVARAIEMGGLTALGTGHWVGGSVNPGDQPLVESALRGVDAHFSARPDGLERPRWRTRPAPRPPGRRSRLELLYPVMSFGHVDEALRDELHALYQAVGNVTDAGIRDRTRARDLAAMVQGTLREMVANACRHAQATSVNVVAAITHGISAQLEFAVVDNGIGIGESQRRAWGILGMVPERHFVHEVLRPRSSSGRDRRGPGRGCARLERELVRTGASVRIRTGGVLVRMTATGSRMAVVSQASDSLGTTIHVTVPLDVGPR